ncbi:MAG TPA: 2-oxo-4-hydroxy-4-carboxy-5-ureidoimidazoline decarboxylase [Gemmatimonadaceae bacterium]|nr:2-oxo-4-hydroxy-4-carboxy-5-ureidoimidazoline decarboxylase [Gemmatimonadaceae bacterium]
MTTVAELDAMSESEAAEALRACCGSSRWVDAMTARRPFRSRDALFKAADEEWSRTNENDWLEAFSHHPRIGDRSTKGWAAGEQQGAQNAAVTIQDELARINREYEDRFGHIYIVCATGKTADEMLAIAKSRMSNDRESELRAAAEEQRKIMQIRLEKLTGELS